MNLKVISSVLEKFAFVREISIPDASPPSALVVSVLNGGVVGSGELGCDWELMVILPTPTHLLVPMGRPPDDGTRVHPPLYQSLLPSCSLSSMLHEGAPPEPAL